jgi:hypothetical protein
MITLAYDMTLLYGIVLSKDTVYALARVTLQVRYRICLVPVLTTLICLRLMSSSSVPIAELLSNQCRYEL